MSVSFIPQYRVGDERGFQVMCDQVPVSAFDSESAARVAAAQHEAECEDCAQLGSYLLPMWAPEAGADLEVNVSSANARVLLSTLGLSAGEDLCGSCDATDFLGRVLLAQAISPVGADQMRDTSTAAGATGRTGMQVIMCRRPDGWLENVLANLHAMATHAIAHGRDVSWG